MHTTISIKDDLLVEAEAAATSSGQTTIAFIEDAIRRHLDARKATDVAEPPEQPDFGDGGTAPGVDPEDADALLETMKFGLGLGS
ncbi:MAG: DUF2191 domain-containing protein [Actinobacteria bacterium]|nr:DUF2191 domain-containing protein [Actinomycetota bacterium]